MPNLSKNRPNGNPDAVRPCGLFSRPPLAHLADPIEREHYEAAYHAWRVVFRAFSTPMLNAAANAARDVRHEREVGG